MARTLYALAIDVLRRFDPSLTQSNLDSNDLFGNEDEETITARIEAVERELDSETGHAFRETRVGNPGEPFSYEHHDSDFRRYQGGVRVWLDHYPVIPIDSTEGDSLEIRTARSEWRDLTDDEGSLWEANWREGTITVYAPRYAGPWRHAAMQNNVRISYRYGAFGADPQEGGQTTLSQNTTGDGSDVQLDVTDASRLPGGGLLNLGGVEYAHMTERDLTNDTITVTRGVRHTDKSTSSLEDGDTVHYCPEQIRDAVAAKSARDLILVDHIGDNLPTPQDDLTFRDWLDELESEYQQAVMENAEATMV